MKIVKVLCGVIWSANKVFIARRKVEKSQGGNWEFPGGKINENEKPDLALIRELKEELGMEVTIKNYFGNKVHQYENISIDLVAYTCEFVSASYQLIDHDEYCFVNPTELTNYKMAPADIFIVEQILNNEHKV